MCLDVSLRTVTRLIAENRLAANKIGQRILEMRDVLLDFSRRERMAKAIQCLELVVLLVLTVAHPAFPP